MASLAYERIKQIGKLPSPEGVAQEILRVANDESTTIHDIADVVEKDPATASRLLKLVNSPLAGVSRRIAAIPQAVALLGLDTVKSTALGFSLISQFKQGPCKGFDYEAFWSGSVATAVAARHIAHICKQVPPEEVFICGLLCQVGRLAFATVYPQEYGDALNRMNSEGSSLLAEVERALFGLDSNQLSAEMMADWGLPALYCDAVSVQGIIRDVELKGNERMVSIARTLRFSVDISNVLLDPTPDQESISSLYREAPRLNILPDIFAEVFDSISLEWQAIGSIFDVSTHGVPPLAEMCPREFGS